MALHVRGVVLPTDEVVDLWLVGDRVTRTPMIGADTISDGGFILPGLVDAHCHIGIAP
ncbi:MAG TPA: amidohydrolase, partial [Micromonosporaceae bacterium]